MSDWNDSRRVLAQSRVFGQNLSTVREFHESLNRRDYDRLRLFPSLSANAMNSYLWERSGWRMKSV